MKVLLTDGNFKHTLAAARSLGERGIEVGVVSHMKSSITFRSIYCKHKHIAPESRHPDFPDKLVEIAKKYDAVIPVSYAAVMASSLKRKELGRRIAIPSQAALTIAGHKGLSVIFAENLGLHVPRTFHPSGEVEYMNILLSGMKYPYVVKSPIDSGNMVYVNTDREFVDAHFRINPCIVQEYIKGDGYGFFALYNNGKIQDYFMHRRIREYPPTGGPSALAESIYDPELFKAGRTLLDGLEWHGPAMVEFKKDKDGNFILMEINPKLWGSLELGIASGVDFPYKICELIMTGKVKETPLYQTGVKFRWPFSQDALNAISTGSYGRFFQDFRNPEILSDIDVHDIKPNIMQVLMTFAEFFIRVKNKKLMRPHSDVS